MNVYEYLYYKLYRFSEKYLITKKAKPYDMLAVAFISILFWLNITSVFIFLKEFNQRAFFPLFILILMVNCFYFLFRDRYKIIYEKYCNETKKKKKIGTIMVLSYVTISICLLILSIKK
jgi:hypothetical protein